MTQSIIIYELCIDNGKNIMEKALLGESREIESGGHSGRGDYARRLP